MDSRTWRISINQFCLISLPHSSIFTKCHEFVFNNRCCKVFNTIHTLYVCARARVSLCVCVYVCARVCVRIINYIYTM